MSALLEWPSVPNVWFKWLLELGERPVKLNDCWTRDWQTSLFHSAKRWLFHIDNYPPVHSFSVPRLTFLPCTSSLGQLHVYQNGIWPLKGKKAQKNEAWISANLEGALLWLSLQWPKRVMGSGTFYARIQVLPVECKEVCALYMCELWDMRTWILHYFIIGMISKFCNTVV